MQEYRGYELIGKKSLDVVELDSRHNPEKSLSLVYYVKTKSDLIKVAKEMARFANAVGALVVTRKGPMEGAST